MGLIRAWDPWDYTEVIRGGWVALQKSKTKNLSSEAALLDPSCVCTSVIYQI
jgi:hypothetical protein